MKTIYSKEFFLLIIIVLILVPPVCFAENIVWINYRESPVNLDAGYFDYQNTDVSSWIRGVWYDTKSEYLIINLNGTYYHYCGVPQSIWLKYKDYNKHESFGRAHNTYLKGKYDCRKGYVPEYN